MNLIEKKVEEFMNLRSGYMQVVMSGTDAELDAFADKMETWLRTALEEAFLQGRDISMKADEVLREEGRADCKRKAETAALMALNACGVPEEEAVKHARIAVESVF